jgi:hypothetical protein
LLHPPTSRARNSRTEPDSARLLIHLRLVAKGSGCKQSRAKHSHAAVRPHTHADERRSLIGQSGRSLMCVALHPPTLRPMDDGARDAVVQNLVRDSGAVPDSIEIIRDRQVGGRVTAVARWTEARTGQPRRGAIDVVMTDGVWRASGGWSTNANHDSAHPVWRAWGRTADSTSGWVADPAGATVRFRESDRIETDAVENGVAILIYEATFSRASVVEVLDGDGNVLHSAPVHQA